MCNTTILTALDRILKLLIELVSSEMKSCASNVDIFQTDFVGQVNSVSSCSRSICSYCRMKGHTRRRCYHATRACFECGSPDHFVRNCSLKKTLIYYQAMWALMEMRERMRVRKRRDASRRINRYTGSF